MEKCRFFWTLGCGLPLIGKSLLLLVDGGSRVDSTLRYNTSSALKRGDLTSIDKRLAYSTRLRGEGIKCLSEIDIIILSYC